MCICTLSNTAQRNDSEVLDTSWQKLAVAHHIQQYGSGLYTAYRYQDKYRLAGSDERSAVQVFTLCYAILT